MRKAGRASLNGVKCFRPACQILLTIRNADQDRTVRACPNRQIGFAVTRIVEVVADLPANAGKFGRALEIRVATSCDDEIEQTEIRAHLLGDRTMRGSCEHDLAATFAFALEIVDKRFAIRECLSSKIGVFCNFGLERGAPADEPERQSQQV
ncbi:hypothetical protein WK78_27745 [Burkholderia cepacia]|nr:hypothetical protein WK78_27745 [Burkholderia cepacia]